MQEAGWKSYYSWCRSLAGKGGRVDRRSTMVAVWRRTSGQTRLDRVLFSGTCQVRAPLAGVLMRPPGPRPPGTSRLMMTQNAQRPRYIPRRRTPPPLTLIDVCWTRRARSRPADRRFSRDCLFIRHSSCLQTPLLTTSYMTSDEFTTLLSAIQRWTVTSSLVRSLSNHARSSFADSRNRLFITRLLIMWSVGMVRWIATHRPS